MLGKRCLCSSRTDAPLTLTKQRSLGREGVLSTFRSNDRKVEIRLVSDGLGDSLLVLHINCLLSNKEERNLSPSLSATLCAST